MDKIKGQYRQGDVLLNPTMKDFTDKDTKEIKHSDELIALAYGEVSGHVHSVATKDATMYEWQGDRILTVKTESVLKHGTPGSEEATKDHNFIKLPISTKEVIQQTEYSPAAILNVAD